MANRIDIQVGYTVDKTNLQQLQTALNDIIVQSKLPGSNLNANLQKAAATARTLEGILNKAFNADLGSLNVNKFNQELLKSNINIQELKTNLQGAGTIGATAFNSLNSGILNTNIAIKQSNKLLDDMATTMANTVRWAITSSIFNNLTGSIQKAYTYTKNLDISLNDIRIVTDKNAESMETFARQANNAAKALGASTLDYTKASLIYYQQGLSDEEAQARAETTLKAANVTGQSGEEVSEQLTAVWNGYKVTAEETELYVDKLAAVAASTASDLEELSVGMSKVASAAAAMGVDIDKLNGMLSTVISVTRQAPESAGTAFKTIFARMEDLELEGEDEFGVSLGEVSSSLESMGVHILDAQGSMRELGDVIEEVGNKWNSGAWSEAEKQALAIDLAGKRQYNNLLALFENWDMYNEAVQTSIDSVGTLQHQQDIYMESTGAKLQILKATFQDTYGSLINTDELNTGIEALTNLVQVFDNFIDSFGGGIKSIGAFGAIVANIFNKQISAAITNATLNSQKYAQNVDLLKAKMESINAGVSAVGTGAQPIDIAMQQQLETELRYAQQIQQVRMGINSEQYNELTALQQKMGQLEYEATLTEQTALAQAKKVSGINESQLAESSYLETLSLEVENRKAAAELTEALTRGVNNELKNSQDLLNVTAEETELLQQLYGLKESLLKVDEERINIESKVSQTTLNELDSIINLLNTQDDIFSSNESIRQVKARILRLTQDINREEQQGVNTAQQRANATEAYQIAQEQAAAMRQQEGQIEQEFNQSMEYAQQAVTIGERVTTITSSLSSMAMAWSTMNSIFQTWSDENASLGDKITQTLMSVGIAIPMVISSFNKLNQALGFSSTITDVLKTKNELKNAVDAAGLVIRGKVTAQKVQENIIDTASVRMASLKNLTTEESIAILQQMDVAQLEQIGLTEAQIAALGKATAAQDAFNTSMLANPITWIVAALAAVVGALAIYSNHLEKVKQQQIELNKTTYETSKALYDAAKEESDAVTTLYQNYINMKSKLDDSAESKENLKTATEQLCDALGVEWDILDKLQDKYGNVNQAILEQQKEKIKTTLKSAQETVTAGNDRIEDVVDSAIGETNFGHNIGVNLDSTSYDRIFATIDYGLFPNDDEKVLKAFTSYLEKNYKDKLYSSGRYNTGTPNGILNFNEGVSEKEALDIILEGFKYIRDNSDELGITTKDKNESEAYQWLKTLYNDSDVSGLISEVDTAKQSIDDSILQLADLEAQLFNANNDPSKITNTEELNAYKQQYIEQLKATMEEYGIETSEYTNEYFENLANQYLSGFENLTTVLEDQAIEEAIRERVGSSDEVNSFLEQVKNENGLRILAQVNLDEIASIETIQSEYENIKNKVELDAIQTQIEVNTKAQGEIISEDGLTKETRQELENIYNDAIDWSEFDLSTPIEQLRILNELQYENNAGLLENNLRLPELEKNRKQAIEDLKNEYSELGKLQESLQNGLSEIFGDTYAQAAIESELSRIKTRMTEIHDELEFLDRQNIDIDIDTTQFEIFDNIVDSILSEADVLKSAAELIGEGFIVAKEDAEEFAKIYPALLENAEVLADGQIQLNSAVVQAIMNGNSAVLTSDANKTDGLLQNQLALLDAEIAYQRTVITNLQNYIAGTQTAEETKTNIKKAAADFESTLTEGLTNEQLKAFNAEMEGSKVSTDVALQNLDKIGMRVAEVSEAYAKMLTGEQVSYSPGGAIGIGGDAGSYNSNFNVDDYSDKTIDGQSAKVLLEQAQSELDNLLDTRAAYTDLLSKLRSGTNEAFDAMNRAAAGTGEEKNDKGDSPEKGKDPDYIEYLKDEADRYHDINLELEKLETNLNRLNKQQSKLYGKDLIKNLNKQLKVLEQQKIAYKEKIALAKQEAAELKSSLASQGVSFSKDGHISNYTNALQAKLNYVNTIVAQYNTMSAKDQENFKDTVDAAKEDYENFKKQIEDYDKLISNTIPDLKDKTQDAIDKEIENNITKFTMEVELRLDMAEAEKDFNEFKRKVIDGIKDDDILGNATSKLKDYTSYFNTNGTGTGSIQELTNQINETIGQIKQINKNGWSNIYGNDKAKAMEDLKKYYEELMKQLKDTVVLVDEIKESYLSMIDEAVEAFDKQVDQYEYITDLLNHNMNIIGLVYGDKAYAKMAQYYEKIEQNNNQELDFLKKRVAYAEKMMQKETDPKAKEKWEKEWIDSLSKLNDKVEDSIQNLIDKYQNAINKAFDELDKKITNGKGLDYVNDEWDLINKNADQYLDTINSMYAIQDLENKYLEALDQTDSLSAQQKLNDMMNEQLGMLKDKDKLTQYDVDRANMLYEIALKQIALEEAQQNKSKMRLRRDSQGNYSYQFVSDEDSIAQAQQDLLAAQNDLYNLDKEKYKENLNEIYEYYVEFQEKYTEIMTDMSLTDEERQERIKLLQEQYGKLINGLVEQNETIKQNLHESTFIALEGFYTADAESFKEMTGKDIEAFRDLTDVEKDLVINDLIPQWDSGIQHMADVFAGEGGFIPTCKDAFEELDQATRDYRYSLDELESSAGINFDAISEGHDKSIEKARDLLYANNDLIIKYMEEANAILDVIAQLEKLIAKYNEAKVAAIAATKAAYKFDQKQKKAAANAAGGNPGSPNNSGGSPSNSSNPGGNSSNSSSRSNSGGSPNNSGSSGGNSGSGGDGVPQIGDVVTYTGGLYYYDEGGTSPTGSRGPGKKVTITKLSPGAPYPIHVQSSDSAYGWLKQSQISGYDTGGYTGDWGDSSGKLAFLHKKELVLNNDDTTNFLTAIGIVRDMAGMLNNLNANVMDRLFNLSTGFGIPMSGISAASDTIEQNVHIEASFPNVQNSQEIKDAFNNLVNTASQRAFKTKK